MELKIFTYLAHSSGEIIGRNFKLGRDLTFPNAKVVVGWRMVLHVFVIFLYDRKFIKM